MVNIIIVKTNSGATYRAPVSEINVTENGLFGFWDMRLNLIRNPKTYEVIRPADIKAVDYVH